MLYKLSVSVLALAILIHTLEKYLPDNEGMSFGVGYICTHFKSTCVQIICQANFLQDLPRPIQIWYERGLLYEIDGRKMFARVQEPIADKRTKQQQPVETLILIHGFPTSSYDYHKVLEQGWLDEYRTVLFDHVGFGFSEKPDDVSAVFFAIVSGPDYP